MTNEIAFLLGVVVGNATIGTTILLWKLAKWLARRREQ